MIIEFTWLFAIGVAALLCSALASADTVTQLEPPVVTIDTFVSAEADNYFRKRVEQGALGKFVHVREPAQVDNQTIIRMNRDTPLSWAIFDLTNPVTIVKPDTRGRFQSIMVVNQDHYIQQTIYKPGTYTFTQKDMGTRYIQMTVRTFVDPNDPKDVAEMVKAQDGLKVIQASPGTFEAPNWDQQQLDGLRKAILSIPHGCPTAGTCLGARRKRPKSVTSSARLADSAGIVTKMRST